MARRPNPQLRASALRPSCPPVQRGVAVSVRDRWTFVRLHAAGLSYAAISRLPFIGRCARTVRSVCNMFHASSALAVRAGARPAPRRSSGVASMPEIDSMFWRRRFWRGAASGE